MAKPRRRKGGRTTPKGTRPRGDPFRSESRTRPREPDLLEEIALATADTTPLGLLVLVSALLAALDPRQASPFEPTQGGDVSRTTRQELVQSFLGVACPETSAALAVISALSEYELERARIEQELVTRQAELPRWLERIDESDAYRAVEMTHVLRDGDNVVVGVRWPDDYELSVVVYIDHNLGGVVKDAFVLELPIQQLIDEMRRVNDDPDMSWNDLARADVRARISEAIEVGVITFPPLESDTWPACRPLVEWATRLLPAGGVGYLRPEWDDEALGSVEGAFPGLAIRSIAGRP